MNGSIVALALACIIACSSTPALSAEATVSATKGNHVSVEVKPLSLLVNAIPGSHGFAGGIELPLGDHVAAFGTVTYMSLRLPDSKVTDTTSKADSTATADALESATIHDLTTGAARGGLRYYNQINDDSWYAGAGAGAGNTRVTWKRNGEILEDKSVLFTAGIEAGYRWIWTSGFLMRVGGELSANNVRSRSVSAASTTSTAAIDDVTKQGNQSKSPLTTGFDFGVGWAF